MGECRHILSKYKNTPKHDKIKELNCQGMAAYREQIKNDVEKKLNRVSHSLERTISCKSKIMVANIKHKVCQGPFYICVCCERLHYRDATIFFEQYKYSIQLGDHVRHVILVASYDSKYYVCKTCHKRLFKGNVPYQASWNKLTVCPQP